MWAYQNCSVKCCWVMSFHQNIEFWLKKNPGMSFLCKHTCGFSFRSLRCFSICSVFDQSMRKVMLSLCQLLTSLFCIVLASCIQSWKRRISMQWRLLAVPPESPASKSESANSSAKSWAPPWMRTRPWPEAVLCRYSSPVITSTLVPSATRTADSLHAGEGNMTHTH